MRSIIYTICLALTTLMVVSVSQTAHAGSFHNGTIIDNYTFNDGYWWKGDSAYVRNQKAYTYHDGCCRRTSYRTVFSHSHDREVAKVLAPTYEGWRKDLLKMASDQLARDFELKSSQQDQKEYLEAIKALGIDQRYLVDTTYPSNLTGNETYGQMFRQQGPYALSGSQSTHSAPYAQQGATVYGYDSVASVYPDVDLKVLYNQSSNLAQGLQDLAGQSTGDFNGLLSQTAAHRAEVARIIARGQAAAQVLQMLKDDPLETSTRTEFTLKQDDSGGWKIQPRQPGDPSGYAPGDVIPPQPQVPSTPEGSDEVLDDTQKTAFFDLVQNKCIACHGPSKKDAGLDMTRFLSFDDQKKRETVARLVTDDPSSRMPKAAGGGPGIPLSFEEVTLFFRAAGLSVE